MMMLIVRTNERSEIELSEKSMSVDLYRSVLAGPAMLSLGYFAEC